MTPSTAGMATGVVGVIGVLAEIALLAWLIFSSHSTARKLAIIGMSLFIVGRIVAAFLPMAAASLGIGVIALNSVITGGLWIAGIVCLLMAFMRLDAMVTGHEHQPGSAPRQQHWASGPQDSYRPYQGNAPRTDYGPEQGDNPGGPQNYRPGPWSGQ
ncbi:hypothetical protein [Propionimicrobium sp. PCR01-08-3]|uniref:hypothetical protein n=1 Tax=Propionimicrobium sp. PCR01-08-3 TaxID=3052086 RepID=UPI00255C878B|nr:hypothetical protein [Propionimicrobium sp. PCR01-08-3]WIY82747.1 hypothetical protein QQ658_14830 [Propionimicrobium sp. PCR01-08-3]